MGYCKIHNQKYMSHVPTCPICRGEELGKSEGELVFTIDSSHPTVRVGGGRTSHFQTASSHKEPEDLTVEDVLGDLMASLD
jgi:hypothetical protein